MNDIFILPKIADSRGNLSIIEEMKQIPHFAYKHVHHVLHHRAHHISNKLFLF